MTSSHCQEHNAILYSTLDLKGHVLLRVQAGGAQHPSAAPEMSAFLPHAALLNAVLSDFLKLQVGSKHPLHILKQNFAFNPEVMTESLFRHKNG